MPREPVRAGDGPGTAAKNEPVPSGAAGTDSGVLGEGTAPGEHQLDGPRSGEPGALAAKARRHREAAVKAAPLARYSA